MYDDAALRKSLRERFGHPDFRPGQLDVIKRVLAGQHALAVMPTGAGKSLCYQLPAVLLEGVTLVVSPLLALMRDQVDSLKARGIEAALINSSQDEASRTAAEQALAAGRLRLLLVAPERFRSASFMRAIAAQPVALLAIDEAHCISEWGHAFRPDYERLGEACAHLSPARLLALTATASPDVRQDIIRSLRMRSPHVAVAGFDRPNIHLEVHALQKEAEKRDTLLAAVRRASPAIVYTATRRQAGELAAYLVKNRVRAAPYHAGLDTAERDRHQAQFAKGELDVITATNAFGLGVDKQDVRLVVHSEIPRSLEAYYQEVGRAGRDGEPASGMLLFSEKDVALQRHLLKLAHPSPDLVRFFFDRVRTAARPITANEIAASKPGAVPAERTAALAYLESLGLLERRTTPQRLTVELAPGATADGDGLKNALFRLLGGRRGSVPVGQAATALGARTLRELNANLAGMEAAGDVRRKTFSMQVTYVAPAGAELTAEHVHRLRVRGARDRARLLQLVALARRAKCRRHELLRALGELDAPRRCDACDVCVGPRFVPVRSQLEPARAATRLAQGVLSDLSGMVPGPFPARPGRAPTSNPGQAH